MDSHGGLLYVCQRGFAQMRICVSFFRDESGATAIEYALVGSLISVACIGVMSTVGNTLVLFYTAVQTALIGAL